MHRPVAMPHPRRGAPRDRGHPRRGRNPGTSRRAWI